eukprot:TRINITY_DN295_c4_g1_i2.p1 TRINITY_DN295_c4_g1~~TRINITY_DN295_c4_g1_i2.p1  ORF type:complete len:221 (-),score=55.59 TRINITY_DN295_c4_g1_i2:1420-2082(-)
MSDSRYSNNRNNKKRRYYNKKNYGYKENVKNYPNYSPFGKYVVHVKRKDFDVYIGRKSPAVDDSLVTCWGNPFKIDMNKDGYDREGVVQKFREYIVSDEEMMVKCRKELKDKVLACWCSPKLCHGHVLAYIANSEEYKHYDDVDLVDQNENATNKGNIEANNNSDNNSNNSSSNNSNNQNFVKKKKCSSCLRELDLEFFSKKQWKKPENYCKCTYCTKMN